MKYFCNPKYIIILNMFQLYCSFAVFTVLIFQTYINTHTLTMLAHTLTLTHTHTHTHTHTRPLHIQTCPSLDSLLLSLSLYSLLRLETLAPWLAFRAPRSCCSCSRCFFRSRRARAIASDMLSSDNTLNFMG